MKTEIEVKSIKGHYEIYVHGEFYRSCDVNELSETMQEIEQELKEGANN